MDSLPLPIAKEEYMRQVENAVIPQIFKGFLDMFNEAKEETKKESTWAISKTYLILERFQKFLRGIKKWNDTILKEATDEILKEVPSFKKLVVTILLGNITILTAIKLKGSDSNIKVKIPPMSVIVHKIYRESARTFYYKPELFLKPEEFSNRKEIHDIIKEAVSEALSQCIPIDDILEETIGENYDNPELSGDLLNRKSEISDSEDEPESEEEAEPESEEEISEEEPEISEEEPEPESEEEPEISEEESEPESLEANDSEEEETVETTHPETVEPVETHIPPVTPKSPERRIPFSFQHQRQNKFHFAKPHTNSRPIPKLKLKTSIK